MHILYILHKPASIFRARIAEWLKGVYLSSIVGNPRRITLGYSPLVPTAVSRSDYPPFMSGDYRIVISRVLPTIHVL